MKIYLVRHGEALSPEINPDKPLSPEGRGEIEKLARFLAKQGFPLSSILHSPKLRALQTAEILKEALSPGLKLEKNTHLNPEDSIEYILERIRNEDKDLMIVGHLPFLNLLLGGLVTGDEDQFLVHFRRGSTVCLIKTDYQWVIEWVLSVDLVKNDLYK
jgi:phosphohistidine phosphatase